MSTVLEYIRCAESKNGLNFAELALVFEINAFFLAVPFHKKNAFISKTRANSAKLRPFLDSAHLIYPKTVDISSAKICVLASAICGCWLQFSLLNAVRKKIHSLIKNWWQIMSNLD